MGKYVEARDPIEQLEKRRSPVPILRVLSEEWEERMLAPGGVDRISETCL
jgi:hypothetical protein